MEHILQFAISIDDKAIEERVIEKASKEAKDDIVRSLRSAWGFSDEAKIIMREVVESYKDEIIQETAKMLCASVSRSKKFNAMLDEASKKIAEELNKDGIHQEETCD